MRTLLISGVTLIVAGWIWQIRRYNWAEQERFWAHEPKLNRGRNHIAVAALVNPL